MGRSCKKTNISGTFHGKKVQTEHHGKRQPYGLKGRSKSLVTHRRRQKMQKALRFAANCRVCRHDGTTKCLDAYYRSLERKKKSLNITSPYGYRSAVTAESSTSESDSDSSNSTVEGTCGDNEGHQRSSSPEIFYSDDEPFEDYLDRMCTKAKEDAPASATTDSTSPDTQESENSSSSSASASKTTERVSAMSAPAKESVGIQTQSLSLDSRMTQTSTTMEERETQTSEELAFSNSVSVGTSVTFSELLESFPCVNASAVYWTRKKFMFIVTRDGTVKKAKIAFSKTNGEVYVFANPTFYCLGHHLGWKAVLAAACDAYKATYPLEFLGEEIDILDAAKFDLNVEEDVV